ncbi:hypothetical protein UXO62_10440 [Enterobacter cloacae]|uniref:hypothetical protein n=1 Tax=Enterobacter cloacae TaxID=550 RepID=UPI002FD4B100
MIKNLTPVDQLSVGFIKWGKTIIFKGDCRRVPEDSRFFTHEERQGNGFDIIMLNTGC